MTHRIAAFVAPLLFLLSLPAQDPVASVHVVNLAGQPRSSIVTTVLPWAQGEYYGQSLSVAGTALDVRQLGASWPDGSWRYARTHVPVRVEARSRVLVPVSRDTAAPTAFRWTQSVAQGAAKLRIILRVGAAAAAFGAWQPIENGNLVKAWRSRIRVPGTVVWGECVLEALSGHDLARAWISFGDSDPRDPALSHALPAIELEVAGAHPVVRHGQTKVLAASFAGNAIRMRVCRPATWADGESQTLHLSLLFPTTDWQTAEAERTVPLLAVADGWAESGAFGPWGYVPESSRVDEAEARRRATADYRAIPIGDPWAAALLGNAPYAGQPGDQTDFSSVVMTMAAAGQPHRLYAIDWSVRQSACRPTHLRDETGAPVLMSQDPDILLWDCRPDMRITRNRLGKEPGPSKGHGAWQGHAVSHYSINYLATYALLTGDRWALSEIDHHCETWLGMVRVNSGNTVLDSMGSARTVGRTLQVGTWLYLLTGRQDIAERLRARVALTAEQWVGRTSSPVRILAVEPKKGSMLDGRWAGWKPWMEAIGVRGLDAVAQVLGDETAADLSRHVARTVATWGIWQTESGWTAADALRWIEGGAALTADQIADGGRFEYRPFLLWIAPALVILEREAVAAGDEAMAARCRSALGAIASDWRSREWVALR